MSIKKSREEIAYNYLKECGPCLITYPKNEKIKILLSASGEVFWLNDEDGPNIPHLRLEDIYQEVKHLLLELFTADMKDEISLDEIYDLENLLRSDLADCLEVGDLKEDEVREIKIKFMDVKESLLSPLPKKEVKPSVSKKEDKSSVVVETKEETPKVTELADNDDEDENPFKND